MKRLLLAALVTALIVTPCLSADLVTVSPVTDKVIVLIFDDGYIEKHGYHEGGDMDESYLWPLNLERAENPLAYLLSSSGDANFASGQYPVSIGRKSKAHDISKKCKGWNEEPWEGAACKNDYASYHYIYLELPYPLVSGNTYTIDLKNVADNMESYTFTYDVQHTRAISIHTNSFGYAPQARKKYSYISQWMGTMGPLTDDNLIGKRFDLMKLDASGVPGASVHNGTVAKQKDYTEKDNNRSNETPNSNYVVSNVYECDFSAVTEEGEYILAVEGVGASYPFRIHADAYHEPFYWTMKGLYLERALIDAPVEFGLKWAHPAWDDAKFVYTHVRTMDLTDESGNNQKSNIFQNFDWTVDLSGIRGWYHDAGDWDGYVSHFRIPRTLMHAYELSPDNFKDGELDIPEAQVAYNGYSGTHIPDILDEAVWLVDYFKNNVGPTGGIFGSRVHPDISTTSGINPDDYPDFVFRDECRIDGIPSWEDCCTWIVHGEDPLDSYAFASIAAQYAFNLGIAEGKTGEDYTAIIAEYADSAVSAWTWAQANTLGGDESKKNFVENRAAAAAWLYKITGEQGYLDQLKSDLSAEGISASTTNLGESKWAVWAYATIDGTDPLYSGTFDATLQSDLRNAIKKYANDRVTNAIDANRSMRWGGSMLQPVWNGQGTTPWILPAMVAAVTCSLDGDPDAEKYEDACYTTNDYFLGGNQLNMTWLTSVGHEHTEQMLHHDSEYNPTHPGFIPGIPVYGPRVRCDWFAPGSPHPYAGDNCYYNNSHDGDFALLDGRLYPAYTDQSNKLVWPVHELYFENYGSPPTNEFTVHQTVAPAAAAYGFTAAPGGSAERNVEPEVVISTASASVTAGDDVTISIVATDTDGWLYRHAIYKDNRLVAEIDGSESSYSFMANEAETVTYHVVTRDNLGLSATSNALEITVTEASDMPSVEITSLASPGYYRVGEMLTIEADAEGQNITVEFYHFNTKIGEASAAPYSVEWTPGVIGASDISAVVIDDRGLTATDLKEISVTENCFSIQIPAESDEFEEGEYVVAKTTAPDCTEDIVNMRFYLTSGVYLDDAVASPADGTYGVTFKELTDGEYTLFALAETASGKIISDTIHFSVVDSGVGFHPNTLVDLAVYPNPSSGDFRFDVESGRGAADLEIRIFDVMGRQIHSMTDLQPSGSYTWHTGGVGPGVYSYAVISGDVIRNGVIILQR